MQLKSHNVSQWHRDAVTVSRMAKQQNVFEMQLSLAAKEAEEKHQKSQCVAETSLINFLVKNHIPHATTLSKLVQLQVMNGELLKLHVEGAANAQYTSSFSATEMPQILGSS